MVFLKTKRTFLFCFSSIALLLTGQSREISLQEIWKEYRWGQDYLQEFKSSDDGKSYQTIEQGEEGAQYIVRKEFTTDKVLDTLYSSEGQSHGYLHSYEILKDNNTLLLFFNPDFIYRYSFNADVLLWDVGKQSATAIAESPVHWAEVSPSGEHVAYVQDNNVFVYHVNEATTERVTTDGEANKRIHGMADWVYEEEFAMTNALDWSSNGEYLIFMTTDESKVKEFEMPMFQAALYPESQRFKYPKAGETNSDVFLNSYRIASKTLQQITSWSKDSVEYIPAFQSTPYDANILVQTLNRHQNDWRIYSIDLGSGSQELIYQESNKAWVEHDAEMIFSKRGKTLFFRSERSGYSHAYMLDLSKPTAPIQLTFGSFEVFHLYGLDPKEKFLFIQTNATGYGERIIEKVTLKNLNKNRISPEKGWSTASFNSSFSHMYLTHSTAEKPNVISLYSATGKQLKVTRESRETQEYLESKSLGRKKFISVPSGKGYDMNGYIIYPPDFDTTKRYPVLMYLYGGPGSQQVTNSWGTHNFGWFQMLAQRGILVACFDNIGTGGRGEEFKKATYLQLGRLETEDQTVASRYMQSLPYVEKSRIGIWGWSYGGFMSSNCLFRSPEDFSLAISVAPVTNWRFYDSIYTERYMRTPAENESGYDENAPLRYASQCNGDFLLIHGTADDNVHFQNSVELIRALIYYDIAFDSEVYPDKNHGIYGGNTRYHLYQKMTRFIENNL